MIEKNKKGNQIGNLRTINLMKADFNFNNKMIVRNILFCAERNCLLLKEQYRSQYRYYIMIQVTNKKLLCNITHLLKKLLAMCSNDDISYYNRIIHLVASLAM